MTPELKKLLASILIYQSSLLSILDEQAEIIHETTLNDFYVCAQSVDDIADYLGVPHDGTTLMDQGELAAGKCSHGVQFYCRDWIYDVMGNHAKEMAGDDEQERFENFVQSMADHGEEFKRQVFGPCPKCLEFLDTLAPQESTPSS